MTSIISSCSDDQVRNKTYNKDWFQSRLWEERPNSIICRLGLPETPPPPRAEGWSAEGGVAESMEDLDFMSTISGGHPKLAMAFNVVGIKAGVVEPPSNLFLDVSHQFPLPRWNSSSPMAEPLWNLSLLSLSKKLKMLTCFFCFLKLYENEMKTWLLHRSIYTSIDHEALDIKWWRNLWLTFYPQWFDKGK